MKPLLKTQIRFATEQDKEEIFRLYRSLVGITGCAWDEEYPSMEHIETDLNHQTLYVMCLKESLPEAEAGTILAAATAGENEEDLNELTCWSKEIQNPYELSRIGVRQDFQGQGLAKELIRHIEQDIQKNGVDGMHFLVSKTNPAALAAYQKLGYYSCGEANLYELEWWCYEKRFQKKEEN